MAQNFNSSGKPTSYFDSVANTTAKNRLALRGLVIVLLLAVAGYYLLKAHNEQYANKAQTAYYEGEKSYQLALDAITPKLKKTDKTTVTSPPVDLKKADTAQAESELQDVLTKYPKTNASFQAALLLSDIYASKDQGNKAIEVLESKSGKKAPSEILSAVVDLKLSSLYEKNNQCDKAITALENIIKDKKAVDFQPESLLKEALCNETLGHQDKAKELYQKLSADFPDTEQGQQANKYLELLSQNGKTIL